MFATWAKKHPMSESTSAHRLKAPPGVTPAVRNVARFSEVMRVLMNDHFFTCNQVR